MDRLDTSPAIPEMPTERDPRWARVVARDRSADGVFYYSVRTTGVYCRASCGARPHPANVRFHDTAAAAEAAGFRPCRNCRPDEIADHAAEEIRVAVRDGALGKLLVATSGRGVCAILLGDRPDALRRDLQARFPQARLVEGDAAAAEAAERVAGLLEAPCRALDLPLDLRGTAFQRLVWEALREIPPGTTASYGEVARRIGQPRAAREVAAACAANPLAVAVPCHRVVKADGSISGYRWGVARKRSLLDREGAAA